MQFAKIIKSITVYLYAKIKYRKQVKLPCKGIFGLHISINSKTGSIKINEGISTRRDVSLNVSDCGLIEIKNHVFINDGTKINARKCVRIGANTIIGQNVLIYDHDHDYKSENLASNFKCDDVVIGDNVWIGSGVIILKGTSIGGGCHWCRHFAERKYSTWQPCVCR